jgi:hypothetical protein
LRAAGVRDAQRSRARDALDPPELEQPVGQGAPSAPARCGRRSVALFGALLGGGLEAGLHRALLIAAGLAFAVAVLAAAHDTFRRWCPTPPPLARSPGATR